MAEQFAAFLSWQILAAVVLLGLAWGYLVTPVVPIKPHTQAILAVLGGSAFFFVVAGVRAFVSPTPSDSIGRELGHVVLWALYVGAGYVGWLVRSARG